MTSTPSPQDHSILLGGSIAARRVGCSGSYALERTLAPQGDTEHTLRGTALHAAMAHYLTLPDETQPLNSLVGHVFEGRTISQEDYDTALLPALTMLDQIIASAGGECDLWVEQPVAFVQKTENFPGARGTIDVVVMSDKGHAFIVDFKFGYHVVSAERNEQLAFYAVALAKTPDDTGYTIDTPTTFVIIQPEPDDDDPKPHCWEVHESYLSGRVTVYEDTIMDAMSIADQVDKGVSLGADSFTLGTHCEWCRAKTICPAQQNQFTGLVDATTSRVVDGFVPDAPTMPPDMDSMLDAAIRVEGFIKALREEATARLTVNASDAPAQWKLIPRKGNRAWTDLPQAEEAMKRFKADERYTKKLVSPAQAEKLCKKHGKTRVWQQKLEPLIDRADKGVNLVHITHKTPGIAPVSLPQLPAAVEG